MSCAILGDSNHHRRGRLLNHNAGCPSVLAEIIPPRSMRALKAALVAWRCVVPGNVVPEKETVNYICGEIFTLCFCKNVQYMSTRGFQGLCLYGRPTSRLQGAGSKCFAQYSDARVPLASKQFKHAIMGLLQLLMSWVNRIVILVSVLLFMLTLMSKETNIPLSGASLRVGHLLSFRSGRTTAWALRSTEWVGSC